MKNIMNNKDVRKINLSANAYRALVDLQAKNGTYEMYRDVLNRLFLFILHASAEMGMSDFEALSTMRTIDMLRTDLRSLAGATAEADETDISDAINDTYYAEVQTPNCNDTDDNAPTDADEDIE